MPRSLMVTGWVCDTPVLDSTFKLYLPSWCGPRTFQVTGLCRLVALGRSCGTVCLSLQSTSSKSWGSFRLTV